MNLNPTLPQRSSDLMRMPVGELLVASVTAGKLMNSYGVDIPTVPRKGVEVSPDDTELFFVTVAVGAEAEWLKDTLASRVALSIAAGNGGMMRGVELTAKGPETTTVADLLDIADAHPEHVTMLVGNDAEGKPAGVVVACSGDRTQEFIDKVSAALGLKGEAAQGRAEAELEAKAAGTLWALCQRFIQKQRIGCVETIYQTDRVIENAYDFIKDVCEVVGYLEDEEEDLDTQIRLYGSDDEA
jgi:hypothetical protein